MGKTYKIEEPQTNDIQCLVEVWEASVRATHKFVTEEDIQLLKTIIHEKKIFLNTNLICVRNEQGKVAGFAGVSGDSLDMLFIAPDIMKTGAGKTLIKHAIYVLGATKVDVNEQNDEAKSFYEHFGFRVVSRSEFDDNGLPFPILHMQLPQKRILNTNEVN